MDKQSDLWQNLSEEPDQEAVAEPVKASKSGSASSLPATVTEASHSLVSGMTGLPRRTAPAPKNQALNQPIKPRIPSP